MTEQPRLEVSRRQILAFRRRVGHLDERLPAGPESLRRAAWAGLQDSMPRAALLSLHARVQEVEPSTWDDPSLAQLWGPRYNTYVVAERDFALFSLGRLPDDAKGRRRAETMAELLHARLAGERMLDREAALGLDINPAAFKYAAPTGTVAIRWDGARAPAVWTVAAPGMDPAEAQRELARRYLQVFGPATSAGFARWAGVSRRAAAATFTSLGDSLVPVSSPLGDEWLLASDEPAMRDAERPAAPARLLPSGDSYTSSTGPSGSCSCPPPTSADGSGRRASGPARCWSTARSAARGGVRSTRCGSSRGAACRAAVRDAVEAEAAALPLPGLDRAIVVQWDG